MPMDGNETEWGARKKRIDKKLPSLNPAWQIISWYEGLDTPKLTCHAVTEIPTANGPADYGFFVNDVSPDITEGEQVWVNSQKVLQLAKHYSSGAFNGTGDRNG